MSITPFPVRGRGSNDLVNPPVPPDPPDMTELAERVGRLDARIGSLERVVESLRGLMDGFKDSLRAMQWSLGIILAVGLAALGWMLSIGNARVAEMNVRLDRFLERQAETASAANARFDRLLEHRAAQPVAPVVIQVPPATAPETARPPLPTPPQQ